MATDTQRSTYDVPLSTLVSQIRAAAATRTAHITALETGSDSDSGAATKTASDGGSSTVTTAAGLLRPRGGLGDSEPLPVLITDANRLTDAYIEVGAVYEGDNTTVLPPVAAT